MSVQIEQDDEATEPEAPKPGRPTELTLERVIAAVEQHDRERRAISVRSIQRECGGSQQTVKAMLERIGRSPLKLEREPDVHDGLVKALLKGIEDHTVGLRQECQGKIDAANALVDQEIQKSVKLANELRAARNECDELRAENGVLQGMLIAERQTNRHVAVTAEAERQRADAAEKELTMLKQQLESVLQINDSSERSRRSAEAELATALQTAAKLQGELLGVVEAKNLRDHDYHLLAEQNKQLLKTLNQLAGERTSGGTPQHPATKIMTEAIAVSLRPASPAGLDRGEGVHHGEAQPESYGDLNNDDPGQPVGLVNAVGCDVVLPA